MTQQANGSEGIESATASAAAILSQLNEMVQGQQHQQQTNHLSSDLLTTTDLSRVQSEKVVFDSASSSIERSFPIHLANSRCTSSSCNIKN